MHVALTNFHIAIAVVLSVPLTMRAQVTDAAVDDLVKKSLKAWEVPGAAVAIVEADKVIYLKGHGVREIGRDSPITPETVFPLGSCGKAFTSVLLAQLCDGGLLNWDDPVRKHVIGFRLSDPNADALVTLRDLVCHRTGVGSHDLLWYRSPLNQQEMIRRLGKLPLSAPFRSKLQYQSAVFAVAGHAAAKAAGRPWEDLIRDRLFAPLGMKTASTREDAAMALRDHAIGHRTERGGKVKAVPWYVHDRPNPAGSISCSARDLVPWLQLHLREGLHNNDRLVSTEHIRETHTSQIVLRLEGTLAAEHPETKQMSYGMGWVIQDYRGELLNSHAGIMDGFRAHVTLMPERKLGIAILANVHATRMNLALSNNLVDLLLKLPPRDWDAHYRKLVADEDVAKKLDLRRLEEGRLKGSKTTLPLAAFAGEYEDEAYGTCKIKMDGERLSWEWNSFRAPLEHFHLDVFRPRGDELLDRFLVEFKTDEGTASALRIFGVTFKRIGPK